MLVEQKSQSAQTKQLLHSIASHLSSRVECRGVRYIVTIGVDDSHLVSFGPVDVKVYPNRYRRCERDKVTILSHVLREHFPELVLSADRDGNIVVDTSKLISGVYEYQASIDNKRRRWVRSR